MWTYKFDYSPRHCWPTNDGKYIIDPIDGTLCSNPEDHPYSRGKAEYMRWLKFFGDLAPNIVRGSLVDGWIKIGPHSEEYGNVLATKFENNFAYVEVDDKFANEARRAVELTDISYAEENIDV